jgi:hypothetical protein
MDGLQYNGEMLIEPGTPYSYGFQFRRKKVVLVWLGVSLLLDEAALYVFMKAVDIGKGVGSPFWRVLFSHAPVWQPVFFLSFVLPMLLWCGLKVAGPVRAGSLGIGLVATLATFVFSFALLYLYAWVSYIVRFH